MVEHVEAGGLRVAYRSRGEGRPVLLLHGGMLDGREWRRQLASLSDGWRVVAWDAPSCGRSEDPPPDWGLDDFARSAIALAGALGLDRPHVVGLSFGAGLALAVHGVDPGFARSLSLLSGYAGWPGSLPPDEVARRLAFCLAAATDPREPERADGLEFTSPDPAPEVLDALHEMSREARPAAYAVMGRAFAAADLRPLLPTIDIPVLVMHGAQDRRCPLPVGQALAAAIPTAELVVVPGAGHMLDLEAPDEVDRLLRRFFLRVEEAEARR